MFGRVPSFEVFTHAMGAWTISGCDGLRFVAEEDSVDELHTPARRAVESAVDPQSTIACQCDASVAYELP